MFTSNYYGFWDYWKLYHKVTFDGPNRVIIINYGETSINIEQDIYSEWKEWMRLEDYSKYPEAMSVIGGEPLGSGQFVGATYFLENGWRIRPWEGDASLTFAGNLYTREEGEDPFLPTLDRWNTNIKSVVSALVFKVDAGGGATGSVSIDSQEIANAVWKYATTGSLTTGEMGHYVTNRLLTFAQYLAAK